MKQFHAKTRRVAGFVLAAATTTTLLAVICGVTPVVAMPGCTKRSLLPIILSLPGQHHHKMDGCSWLGSPP